jgi:hypothetical protein
MDGSEELIEQSWWRRGVILNYCDVFVGLHLSKAMKIARLNLVLELDSTLVWSDSLSRTFTSNLRSTQQPTQ